MSAADGPLRSRLGFLLGLLAFVAACSADKPDTAGFFDGSDRTDPEVTLDAPLDGDVVSGSVAWAATASDDIGVASVQLLVNDDEVGLDLSTPYGGEWDSSSVLNGSYTLSALAEDAAGNEAQSDVSVTVSNADGLDPSAIAITSPSGETAVCGEVTVRTDTSDDVVEVGFSVDGIDEEVDTTAPFEWVWDTTTTLDGVHRVEATAADADGRQAVDRVWVEVDNSVESCDNAPDITFTDPSEGDWLRGSEDLAVSATDDNGVVSVTFYVDDGLLGTLTSVPYTVAWTTTAFADGAHVLKAVATDTIGQTGETEISVSTDNTSPELAIDDPLDGDTVQGTLTFSASASDNLQLALVELALDGDVIGSFTEQPFEVELDTTALAYGEHVFEARAVDRADNEVEETVLASVDNPPLVEFTEPASTEVSGTVTIAAEATDDDLLTSMALFEDGVSVDTTTAESSVSRTIDTCAEPYGTTLEYTAVATDSGGNTTRETLELTVDQPLQVEIGTFDAALDYTDTLSAEVSDDEDISDVVWDVDGTTVLTSTRSRSSEADCFDCGCDLYSGPYDTSSTAEGSHTLTVTVTNASGDTATDSTTIEIDYDHDGDGYDSEEYGGDDCDDADADVSPGASELCDGADNDCDGRTDEDFDADGDRSYDETDCAGLSAGDDCDDTDATVHPGATEICDDIDNDCDGLVDLSSAYSASSTTFSTNSHSLSNTGMYGNVYQATTNAVISSFQAYLSPGSTSYSVTYAVYESATSTGDYTRVASGTGSVSGSSGWFSSPAMDVEMTSGRYYLVAVGTSSALTRLGDATSPSLSSGSGLTLAGYTYSSTASPTTISTDPSTSQTYYQVLTMSVPGVEDADADADGYSSFCGDCDDAEATTSPDGTETCDGVDNDCDDAVDDTVDADGDGSYACYDCDDADATIYPGASERCDGLDDDCDDEIDEDPIDGTTFYRDADGDGYGIPGISDVLCSIVTGFSTLSTDCDDSDASTSPAATEACDGADNDCDGSTDEGFADADGDGYTACTDCADTSATISPGAAEVCENGTDEDCDGWDAGCGYTGTVTFSSYGKTWWGEKKNDFAGNKLAWAGDVDGDGLADMLVGAMSNDDGGTSAGNTYLLYGPASAGGTLGDAPTIELVGEDANDHSSSGLSTAGDQDGDGYDDVLIGAYGVDDSATDAGAAYLVLGPVASDLDLSTADVLLSGEAASDYAGCDVSMPGDVDGDGTADLAVGANYASEGRYSDSGLVYLLYGPVTADLALSAADAALEGTASYEYVGGTLASTTGDHDGDGYDDLLIGSAQWTSSTGRAYVVDGPVSGSLSLSSADALLAGVATSDLTGLDITWMDANRDGYADAVIGAPDRNYALLDDGVAYVVFGPVSSLTLSSADATVSGTVPKGELGVTIDAGDVDNDGYDDLLVGGDVSSSDTGLYLFYGPVTGSVTAAAAAVTILPCGPSGAAFVHDIDGDGLGDFLAGCNGDSHGTTSATGAAYLLPYAMYP